MPGRKRCVGVDIGVSSIKIAELVQDKETIKITKLVYEEVDLTPTATEEERRAELINAVRRALKKNRITAKEAVFSLPGQAVIIRRVKLPKTSPERLAQLIQYEAREQIPFPSDLSRLEYQVFEGAGEGEENDVLMIAIRQDHLTHHMEIINRIPLKAVGIGVSSLALFNYYAYNFDTSHQQVTEEVPAQKAKKPFLKLPKLSLKKEKGKKAETAVAEEAEAEGAVLTEEIPYAEIRAYVNIGATGFDLSIGRHERTSRFGFGRSVPRGGIDITETIRARLGLTDVKEAERVKRERTAIIPIRDEKVLEERGVNKEAAEAAITAVDRIIADVKRSLDFYISQPDGVMVDSIILSGGVAQLPELSTYFEEKLGIPVNVLSSIDSPKLVLEPSLSDEKLALFPVAIGLALQGLSVSNIKIDFLPPELKVLREFKTKKPVLLAMFGVLGLMIAISSVAGNKYMSEMLEQRDSFLDVIERNKALSQKAKEAEEKRKQVKEMYDKLAKIAVKRDYWLEFLADLQKQKPEDVWIELLVLDPFGKVRIVGRAEIESSVAQFTENLKTAFKDKFSEEPKLIDFKRVYDDNLKKEVSRFDIRATCKDKRSVWQEEVVETRPGTQVGRPGLPPGVAPGPAGVPGEMPRGVGRTKEGLEFLP